MCAGVVALFVNTLRKLQIPAIQISLKRNSLSLDQDSAAPLGFPCLRKISL